MYTAHLLSSSGSGYTSPYVNPWTFIITTPSLVVVLSKYFDISCLSLTLFTDEETDCTGPKTEVGHGLG